MVEEYNLVNVDLYQTGILVTRVSEGNPAAKAGLRPIEKTIDREGFTAYIARDIIIAVDGITMKSWSDWHVYFAEKVSPYQTIIITLLRDGLLEEIELTTTYRKPYE